MLVHHNRNRTCKRSSWTRSCWSRRRCHQHACSSQLSICHQCPPAAHRRQRPRPSVHLKRTSWRRCKLRWRCEDLAVRPASGRGCQLAGAGPGATGASGLQAKPGPSAVPLVRLFWRWLVACRLLPHCPPKAHSGRQTAHRPGQGVWRVHFVSLFLLTNSALVNASLPPCLMASVSPSARHTHLRLALVRQHRRLRVCTVPIIDASSAADATAVSTFGTCRIQSTHNQTPTALSVTVYCTYNTSTPYRNPSTACTELLTGRRQPKQKHRRATNSMPCHQ
jgi:hypothetical protein